jgi:hypothetical protein
MVDGFHFDKLVTLNSVYNNTLIQGKTTPQVSVIKTPLYPHQITMVNGMHQYREKMTRGFLVGNHAINGKIGIIGDTAGTGKSLCALSYLASQINSYPSITCELTKNSTKYFYSHDIYQLNDASSANLIIVPHILFNQWKNEIVKHTTMTYSAIETRKALKDKKIVDNICNTNFVLTTNKCYKYVQEYASQNGIHWNNIFIDEASGIYISSSEPPLQFQFLWFITNNWIPLIFKNPSISKSSLYHLRERINIHPDFERWLKDDNMTHYEGTLVSSAFLKDYLPFLHDYRSYIVLRNSTDFIKSSLNLPNYITEIIRCRSILTINSLASYYLARNIEPDINSNKIPYLFQALNIDIKSPLEYIPLQPYTKHILIQRKIKDSECVICLESCDCPTIVNCCYNTYCASCLLKNSVLTQKCPTCRDVLGVNNICCLDESIQEKRVIAKNKTETCIDILKENKEGKIIIYSSFDNIYYQLFEDITKLGLKAERIENNLFSQIKTLKNFNEGKINILFVSSIDAIRGISLETISHLIFYHEQPVYELKQILIHSAQRIGRSSALKVIHLNSEVQV